MRKLRIWFICLIWAVLIWRLTTTPQLVVSQEYWLQDILMMGAHFVFFGIQAVWIRLALAEHSLDLRSFLSITITSIFGLLVELRQLAVPGRSGDPVDWLLDTLGAITFILIVKKLQSRL